MLNLFRRPTQKQYDGPATANADHEHWNPTHRPDDKAKAKVEKEKRARSRGRSKGDGRPSSRPRGGRDGDDGRRRSPSKGRRESASRDGRRSASKGPRRRSSERPRRKSSERPRHTAQQQQALAPGISSRRTSAQVDDHLPARVMAAAGEPVPDVEGKGRSSGRRGGSIPRSISVGSIDKGDGKGDNNNGNNNNSSDNNGRSAAASHDGPSSKPRERRPRAPMEHDGGVLCVCAVPDEEDNDKSAPANNLNQSHRQDRNVHRFLSGGADGTVKLWEVRELPEGGGNMTPRLVRTYRGHRGYVNSIAVLGRLSVDDSVDSSENGRARRKKGQGKGRGGLDNSHRSGQGLDVSCRSRDSSASNDLSDAPLFSKSVSNMAGIPSFKNIARRSSGGGRSVDSGASDGLRYLNDRLLFVSASRDNTMRIWPVVDLHDRGLDDSNEDGRGGPGSSKREPDLLANGMKLRGHEFGGGAVPGGVLCVCALPSLVSPSDDDDDDDDDDTNVDGEGADGADRLSLGAAGQFCSGGADGRVRVWDVRSALLRSLGPATAKAKPGAVAGRIKAASRAGGGGGGSYAAVQLQCLQGSAEEDGVGGVPAPITSLVCVFGGGGGKREEAALFAGDANGIVRRYGRMNECGAGHVNGAIWWGCTGIFGGHSAPITSLAALASPALTPLLCPHDHPSEGDVGAMLVSSSEDGRICVWDALDARKRSEERLCGGALDGSDRSRDDDPWTSGAGAEATIPRREAMWEIDLNEDRDGVGTLGTSSPDVAVGVTSLIALPLGTLMAAATTDGAVRMWNVSSGLYEGAYRLGGSVQAWSLGMLSERDAAEEGGRGDRDTGRKVEASAGIIVSGDNRGRIRVMRKVSTRKV
ncbi:hypothetical protein ACHAWF_007675 [Thalassiosira exigua]